MRILLVHGRGQAGKNPATLQEEWQQALNRGLAASQMSLPKEVEITFPFYGDVLEKFATQFDLAVDEIAGVKGVGASNEFSEFVASVALEAKSAKQISDAEVGARMVALHGKQAIEKGPQNWEWIQSIVSILDSRFPLATEKLFSCFLRDVFLYTRRKKVRASIDNIVADMITDKPTVVVGHSLGSIVAYNVMCKYDWAFPAFVTLGSPLGIRGVRVSLDSPLKNVTLGTHWLNAYDRRDVVALNPLDQTYFPVEPLITNDDTLVNITENHHGISSYLDKSVVARKIIQGLSRTG